MKIYCVGGAIRDKYLGLPVQERDWVVVGGEPAYFIERGFRPVGKSFPVFIHPKTGEEYALARLERKVGSGYTGFECISDPTVSLEEDLKRRDLTINAMAEDDSGQRIDPYGGWDDLQARRLRHVSEAFVEDPLRVLRVARFAAKLKPLGFTLAEETEQLLLRMVRSGELTALSRDRVWLELNKVLGCAQPATFFRVLRQIGACAVLFPQIDALYGVPNAPKWHPEIDSGIHSELSLNAAAQLTEDKAVRFAALVHDLGKARSPIESWPKHHGHDSQGLPLIQLFCEAYPVPKAYAELALKVARYHLVLHQADTLKASTLLAILTDLDIWRRPDRFKQCLLACHADLRGRNGCEHVANPVADFLETLCHEVRRMDYTALCEKGLKGQAMKHAIDNLRLKHIQEFIQSWKKNTGSPS